MTDDQLQWYKKSLRNYQNHDAASKCGNCRFLMRAFAELLDEVERLRGVEQEKRR